MKKSSNFSSDASELELKLWFYGYENDGESGTERANYNQMVSELRAPNSANNPILRKKYDEELISYSLGGVSCLNICDNNQDLADYRQAVKELLQTNN